jgi:hypothetical protein
VQASWAQRVALGVPVPPHTASTVTTNLLVIVLAGAIALFAASLRVHRFSRGHVTVRATLAGRGLDISRTPDGTWWGVRLRCRRCAPLSWWPDERGPDGCGVREPRRPRGPGPLAAADAIDPLTGD